METGGMPTLCTHFPSPTTTQLSYWSCGFLNFIFTIRIHDEFGKAKWVFFFFQTTNKCQMWNSNSHVSNLKILTMSMVPY